MVQTPSKVGACRDGASPPAVPLRAQAGMPAAPGRCARRPGPCAGSRAGPPQAQTPHHRCCWLACPCGCASGSSSCCACPPADIIGRCHAALGLGEHTFRGCAVQLLKCVRGHLFTVLSLVGLLGMRPVCLFLEAAAFTLGSFLSFCLIQSIDGGQCPLETAMGRHHRTSAEGLPEGRNKQLFCGGEVGCRMKNCSVT